MMDGQTQVTNNPSIPLSKEQEDALVRETVQNILALRKLTKDCQTQTSRTQGAILQALDPRILTRVARVLAELENGGVK